MIESNLSSQKLFSNEIYTFPSRSYHILKYSNGEVHTLCLGAAFGGSLDGKLIELEELRKIVSFMDSITKRINYYPKIDKTIFELLNQDNDEL